MEFLPRDIIYEISNYLFHYDLINLKLALPDLNLTKETYLLIKRRTMDFLYLCRSKYIWQIFQNLYDSIYKDEIFTIISQHKGYQIVDVNACLIRDVFKISEIQRVAIGNVSGTVSHNISIVFKNKAELVDKIFNNGSRLTNVDQLSGIFKSRACKQLVRDNLENLKLLDINSYIVKFVNFDRMILTIESLVVIYKYLYAEEKKILIKNINSFLYHPDRDQYIADQLYRFKEIIGCD